MSNYGPRSVALLNLIACLNDQYHHEEAKLSEIKLIRLKKT